MVVKDRLQFILVHDRTQIAPEALDALKLDLIEVFSRYFDLDREGLDIRVRQHTDLSLLVVSLPFRRSKPGRVPRQEGQPPPQAPLTSRLWSLLL